MTAGVSRRDGPSARDPLDARYLRCRCLSDVGALVTGPAVGDRCLHRFEQGMKGGEPDDARLGLVRDEEAPFWGGASHFDVKTRARFWMKVRVAPVDACWDWLASIDRYGYGKFTVKSRISLTSHRTAFLLSGRDIPDGLHLDHLCRNRACCNPGHLEPVTNAENHHRGYWATRTHCEHGHPWTEENTGGKKGKRYCRACRTRKRGVN